MPAAPSVPHRVGWRSRFEDPPQFWYRSTEAGVFDSQVFEAPDEVAPLARRRSVGAIRESGGGFALVPSQQGRDDERKVRFGVVVGPAAV